MSQSISVGFKQTEPITVAFISMKGSYSRIPQAFGELYSWINARGYQPSAPPSGVYFNDPRQVPESELVWELRAPIAGQVPPSEPDKNGPGVKRLESMLVAFATHTGTYESMDSIYYESFITEIAQNAYEVDGPPEEVYLSPPETPAEDLVTEVRFPVRKSPA